MKQILTTSLLMVFWNCCVLAQSNFPTLAERASTSEVIFEGKVIAKEGFWDETKTRIFTKNRVQVLRYIKGGGEASLYLVTQGGEVGDDFQEISHGISFGISTEGLFFCRGFQAPLLGSKTVLMLNGSGGFVGYDKTGVETTAIDHSSVYHNIRKEIYPQIGYTEPETEKGTWPNGSAEGPLGGEEIQFDFANLVLTGGGKLEFDIFAKSVNSSVKFAGGGLFLKYSTSVFGQNLAANNNITLSKGDVIQNAAYSLGAADYNAQTVQITAGIDCNHSGQMYTLGSQFEKLCHASLKIANFGLVGSLTMDSFLMNGTVYYYDPQRGCVPFEKVSVPNGIDKLLLPVIETYDTVATAGTGFLLRIKGTDFGTDKGDVVFRDADSGGSAVMFTYQQDIFKWTQDSIIVRVPSNGKNGAGLGNKVTGSGKFEVRLPSSSGGATAISSTPIEIRYAVHNFLTGGEVNTRTYFGKNIETDGDVNGIFTFSLNSTIQNNDSARIGVVAAMCDWSDKTGVQWNLGPVSSKTIFADHDSTNLIYLAPSAHFTGENANATAFTRLTGLRIEPCAVSVRFMREIDIVVREDIVSPPISVSGGYNFNHLIAPKAKQLDFYSVVAHELGHAHLLRHALPDSKIMYPFLNQGQSRKNISVSDSDGGINVLDSSAVKLTPFPACATAIIKGVGCLVLSEKEGTAESQKISAYPNPFEQTITLTFSDLSEKTLTVFSQLGQVVKTLRVGQGAEDFELDLGASTPAGIYFLTIQEAKSSSSFKIIKY